MLTPQLSLLLLLTTLTSQSQTLYVSPTGSDKNSGMSRTAKRGSLDGPVASLEGARQAVAKLRQRARFNGTVHVKFASGRYRLAAPVHFGPADSDVIYEAEGVTNTTSGAECKVIFDAGEKLSHSGASNVVASLLTTHSMAKFDQLYVNGRRAIPLRSPPSGWFHMTSKYKPDQAHPINNPAGRVFCIEPEVFKKLQIMDPRQLASVVVVIYHAWEISRHHIESLDPSQNAIILKGPGAPWALMEWGANQRYHLEGTNDGMKQGQWNRDWVNTDSVTYLPRYDNGEQPAKVNAIFPRLEQCIIVAGNAKEKVNNLHFRGLSFQNTGYVLPPDGHSDGQAAASIPAVLQVDHAANVTFEGCEVAHTGVYGVWFREGCTNCRVERSYLHDLGAGGIRIGEEPIRPEGPQRTHHNVADNNIIHESGRIFMGSIGIWIGQSGDNHITHNDISDTYYTGISDGWTWGYAEALTRNNHIDFNHIHNIGQGVLSDMGGVYTLGDHRGSTVNNNVIHDVYSYDRYGRGGWGLYTDEGTTGIIMANNLVYNVKTGLFHQHYGKDNVIKNNILVNSMDGQLQRSRVEEHLSFTFEHNIVSWTESRLFSGSWKDKNVALNHNLYWNAGKPIDFEGMDFAAWQKSGKDEGSAVADPQFVDAARQDYRLKPNSPAFKMGFFPFDPKQAGVYGSASWKHLPSTFKYPKVEFRP